MLQTADGANGKRAAAETARLLPRERTLRLEPGPGNTRNSEGDFVRLRDGTWMFVYTRFRGGNGGDHDRAELCARFSRDDGRTWSSRDVTVVANEGGFNVMSVTLRRLPPTNEIALFYLRKNSLSDCRPVLRRSADEGRTWSAPQEIIPDSLAGYYVVNNDRVTRTERGGSAEGRLILPAALHKGSDGAYTPAAHAFCLLSDDAGRTWRRSRTVLTLPVTGSKTGLQEPGVVALRDGRLMLWARTDQGTQWLAFSEDGGETWSAPKPGPLRSPAAPASIKRIPSTGDLVAIWDDNYVPDSPWSFGNRTPLAIAISSDDGVTWKRRRILEPDPDGWYCYTAIAFTGQGAAETLLLGYCAGRGARDGLKTLQIARLPIAALYGAA